MGLLERLVKYDYAVYWAPLSRDQYGKILFDAPVELACRWEEGINVRRDADGNEHIYNGRVFVAQDVDVDGVLWHGRLNDVPVLEGDGNPTIPPDDAKLILRFDKLPNIRNSKFLRTANF